MRASAAGALFPPARLFFELGPECYSAPLLRTLVFLGGNCDSFHQAEQVLDIVLEKSVSARFIQTLTERIGSELAQERDELADQWDQQQLPEPAIQNAPQAVAVAVDDGKVRLRAQGQGPGVHDPEWRNDRVACLMSVLPQRHGTDPSPKPPPALTEPRRVQKLLTELGRVRSQAPACESDASPEGKPQQAKKNKKKSKKSQKDKLPSPTILTRSCVATHTHRDRFGAMVAAEAHRRRFFQAVHAVFLGDGSEGNWSLQDLYFPGWLALLDIIHLVQHLFAGAKAAVPESPWPLYRQLMRAAWAGQAARVLKLLQPHADRLGAPPPKAKDSDPRKIVANVMAYVHANRERMDYPHARRRGLPITTSHVESLINTFNIRVKGPGKFWCPDNVEAVLQVRSACLSTTPRWQTFWKTRGAKQHGRIRPQRRRTAATASAPQAHVRVATTPRPHTAALTRRT